jgi:hypothetical protein
MDMTNKSMEYRPSNGFPTLSGRQFTLFLTGIMALLLAACGGGGGSGDSLGGGGGANAQCTLTAEQLETLTPDEVDSLPKACDGLSIFDVPSFGDPDGKLFILGTEIDGVTGDLKLYVHGLKQNGRPMLLADFQQAVVTVGGVVANRPGDWDVASVLDGGVLSIGLLADYSSSITDTDLNALGALYNTILNAAPAGFEAEVINFSTLNGLPDINIHPEPAPYWTGALPALLPATDVDPAQSRENTPLYDAIGTALLGPLDAIDPLGDGLGLVERNSPATVLVVQTDGRDTASLTLTLGDVTSLIDRCHTTVIMLGTFRSEVDAQILADLAGTRGAFVNALNTNFLQGAIEAYAESLGNGNLVVFTLSEDNTLFAGKTVEINVGGVVASTAEPFDVDAGCQIP